MESKTSKDHLQAVWFAAGMAVVIACVERAVVVSIFRQWHMWVFLALNLLLIAILFTSTYPPLRYSNESNAHSKSDPGQESDKKPNVLNLSYEEGGNGKFEDEEEDGDDVEKVSSLLSNEELNERVEAFISRFRQQYLVSEVKISRSCSESVCGRAVLSKTVTV